MKLHNDTMCILPWISLETSPIGTMRPCCMADTELTDENGIKYEASTARIHKVRDSKQMKELRVQMLAGEKPEMCRRCWAEEDSGRISKRQNTIKRLHKMVDINTWTSEADELMFLDLKLGNICNLKCRICGSWSSSSIAAEDVKAEGKEGFAYTMLKKGAWPRHTETFWEDLYDNSVNIRYLEFTGGEPFMIKEHFEYLQYLVDADLAKDIEIHYNTNGTQWPEKHYLWRQFKHVEIAFSIDNIGDRFEYERDNAKWDNVNNTLDHFIQLRENTSNISLQLCTTVNIFNVMYLEDIVNWKYYNKFDFIFWNMLHDSPEWCITSLPDNAKEAVATKLLKNYQSLPTPVRTEFNNIIKFMASKSSVTLYELMMKIKLLDERRTQHISNTHEELWLLLQEATFEKT